MMLELMSKHEVRTAVQKCAFIRAVCIFFNNLSVRMLPCKAKLNKTKTFNRLEFP